MQTTGSDDQFVQLYKILRAHGIDAIDTLDAAQLEAAKQLLEARIMLYEEKLRGNNFKQVAEEYRADLSWFRKVLDAVSTRLETLAAAV
ncbi:hypothetical protein ACAW74_25850 [Fibrella sp. WM1]|uniref:hypothetical protein n=1 Tax=Fibrella musci TaxID=3242485 RepID=UPI003522501F